MKMPRFRRLHQRFAARARDHELRGHRR
jgi:hypothetical protein